MKNFHSTANDKIKQARVAERILWWIAFAAILIWSVTLIYSLFWMVASSFKDSLDYHINRFGLPDFEFATLDNYSISFKKLYVTVYKNGASRNVEFFELLFNSLYITFVSAFVSVFVPSIVSYVTVKYDFGFNKVLNFIVVVSIVVPLSSSIASSLQIFRTFRVYDNMLIGVIVMRWSFLGMNFLYMAGAFRGIPNDYKEAAEIDGAGHFTILFKIMLPMIKNIFLMFFLLQIISWWNTWDFTYIYMPTHPNLAQAVYNIQFSFDNELVVKPVQLATCIIVILPSLAIFCCFKNQIMQQVSFGGLKG